MSQDSVRCLHCGRTSGEVPLLSLHYADKQFWICPQGLPLLIHKPQQLPLLAGAWTEQDAPAPHHDH
ncbi:MAG: hypothetical protein HY868_20970 [Chloroflexi bacterium]|nr:hypothetical protein [Chloroflexota bacterium]